MTDTSPIVPSSRHAPLPGVAYARMSAALRGGLGVSLAVLLGGLVAYLALHGSEGYGQVIAENPIMQYLGLSGLAAGLASGSVEAYLTLGLLALVATPLLRVLTGCYYFGRAGERTMVTISATVLGLLLFGILVLGPLLR
jgi:uncharacterized membrane protein